MKTNSIDELPTIFDHIPYRFNYLMGVVYQKVREECTNSRRILRVLRTPKDIEDYVAQNNIDMIFLNCPEHMPVVLNRTELGWAKQTEELAEWITEHWKSELLLISVS
jgi:hypothetical protein